MQRQLVSLLSTQVITGQRRSLQRIWLSHVRQEWAVSTDCTTNLSSWDTLEKFQCLGCSLPSNCAPDQSSKPESGSCCAITGIQQTNNSADNDLFPVHNLLLLFRRKIIGQNPAYNAILDQHQGIARKMYESFPEVFKKGGTIRAISSTTGRCIISMSAFCQAMVQCNPKIDIYEQASRATLHGVKPDADDNPYPTPRPRRWHRTMR